MAAPDFLGHLQIVPALNAFETARIAAMGRDHASGPPDLCISWQATSRGGALVPVGVEVCCDPVASLRFLIRNYLKPGALLSRSCLPAVEEFTFDHRLDGVVVVCRPGDRELISITVKANRVTRRMLSGGDVSERVARPHAERRRQPPPSYAAPAVVVDLASRRVRRRPLSPGSA